MREQLKKEEQEGAGFIVVKKIEGFWKFLGLRLNNSFDIPKGVAEDQDGNSSFKTAQRECMEECGIYIQPNDLLCNGESIVLGKLTIFLAKTTQEPKIQKNPKSGIFEHEGAVWLNCDALEEKIYNYLIPAVAWARNKIEF